jgi:hypothetical protein
VSKTFARSVCLFCDPIRLQCSRVGLFTGIAVLQGPDRYLGAVRTRSLRRIDVMWTLTAASVMLHRQPITLLAYPLTRPSRIWISCKAGKCVLATKTPRRARSDGDRFEASENLGAAAAMRTPSAAHGRPVCRGATACRVRHCQSH